MNYLEIIDRYYQDNPDLRVRLIRHSEDVARKALDIAQNHPELDIDRQFVFEAGMLHDIGIFKTSAPGIHCFGREPYLRHGILGAELLRNDGWLRHALVCERHIGAGLTKKEIAAQRLPLPNADFMPVSMEEQLICFADCFFSKTKPGKEKSVGAIRRKMEKFGRRPQKQFAAWCEIFL
ncbi:MAG: HDIG domain-containing protein [Acidobacteria bacterium]|nr:HDIG domain-containing protein [Acidobacteriota bacterium]